jgi:cob(I)alamin adenosyltransferase
MKIYTKRGDAGKTDLFGGGRVPKNNIRVKAYAAIDAANTALGFAYTNAERNSWLKAELEELMKLLFCAGAEIATAPKPRALELLDKHLKNRIENHHIEKLEKTIDKVEAKLCPLKSFILPGGCELAARLHGARIAVRNIEVALLDLLDNNDVVRKELLAFFNRLSDLLFVFARLANHEAQVADLLWSGQLEI